MSRSVIDFSGYTDSWRIQWEESKAAEGLAGAAASLLVSPLPDHMCGRVLLVPARAADGEANSVSSLPDISAIVSVPDDDRSRLQWLKTLIDPFSLLPFLECGYFEKCSSSCFQEEVK